MQVSLLYCAECRPWPLAGQRLRQALACTGRADTGITFVPAETKAVAAAVSVAGSPALRLDGADRSVMSLLTGH